LIADVAPIDSSEVDVRANEHDTGMAGGACPLSTDYRSTAIGAHPRDTIARFESCERSLTSLATASRGVRRRSMGSAPLSLISPINVAVSAIHTPRTLLALVLHGGLFRERQVSAFYPPVGTQRMLRPAAAPHEPRFLRVKGNRIGNLNTLRRCHRRGEPREQVRHGSLDALFFTARVPRAD
jgi:hypothetical protein